MLMRVGMIGGALAGWVAAAVLTVVDVIDQDRAVMAQSLALSVALICSACLALQRHQRPLGTAFEMGYDRGRRDAIREASARTKVTPIRTARSLHELDRVGG